MKRILMPTFVVGLLLGLVSHTYAHIGDRLYPIFELTDADLEAIDLHDGSTGNWLDIVGEPTLTAIEFSAHTALEPYDPADMDFRIWLAWHDGTNRIYVAMEQADDIYINMFDSNIFEQSGMSGYDSSIRLSLDGDHSGGAYASLPCCSDEQAFEYARQAQFYTAIGETIGEDPHVAISVLQLLNQLYEYGSWYTHPPYADGGGGHFGENPVIAVTEFYVTPFDHMVWFSEEESLVSELSPGRIIGFKVRVVDTDDVEDSFAITFFTLPDIEDPTYEGASADFFLDGLLLGPSGAIPEVEDTAVESITWGRIKTSFRSLPNKEGGVP